MYWEEQRVPALPGAEDVTDGERGLLRHRLGKRGEWCAGRGNAEMRFHALHGKNRLPGQRPGTNRRANVPNRF